MGNRCCQDSRIADESLRNPFTVIERIQEAGKEYQWKIDHDLKMRCALYTCTERNSYFIQKFLAGYPHIKIIPSDSDDNKGYEESLMLTLNVSESGYAKLTNFADQFSASQTNNFLKDIETTEDDSAYLINGHIWCEADLARQTSTESDPFLKSWHHVFVVFKFIDRATQKPQYFIFDGANVYLKSESKVWFKETNIGDLKTLFGTKCDQHAGKSVNDFNTITEKMFQISEFCDPWQEWTQPEPLKECESGKCSTMNSVQMFKIDKTDQKKDYFSIRINGAISLIAGGRSDSIGNSAASIGLDEKKIKLVIDNESEIPIEVRLFELSDGEIVVDGDGICRGTNSTKPIKPWLRFTIFKPQKRKIWTINLPKRKRHWVMCVNPKNNLLQDGEYGYAIAKSV